MSDRLLPEYRHAGIDPDRAAVPLAARTAHGRSQPLDELSQPELLAWLGRRVRERVPTAVVRFGDGEAQLLFADTDDEAMEVAIGKLRKETGGPFSSKAVLEIKSLLGFAFDNADLLGIGLREHYSEKSKRWMRRLASLYSDRRAAGRPPALLAHSLLSAHIARALPELIAGRPVSVISCRDLAPVLERGWGVEDVRAYQVPSQHMVRDVDGPYEAALHDVPIWPDAHARVRAELTVRERGEVFLVGAGVFGKDLCIHVRDQGGIAFDMGSILDRMAGKLTRGPERRALDLHASGMSIHDIAADFRRAYGVDVDRESVAQLLDAALAGRPGNAADFVRRR